MSNKHTYNIGSSLQVGERKLTILDNIPVSNGKEVYKVIIGEAIDKNLGLLKLPSNDSREIANTLTFFFEDTQSRMVQIITHDTIDNQIHLLLEFYEKGNVLDYISDHEVSDEEKDTLILTILETGCYLHSKGYLHADIKPDNIFIDDENNPRLGDLESMTELADIHEDTIRDIHGTIGYKYSQGSSYNLSDELFAYLATIYFIEVEEILLNPSELEDLDLGEDSVGAINAFVRTKINKITHTPLKNFLLQTLEDLENYEEIDCCSLLEQFEAIPARKTLEEEKPQGGSGTNEPPPTTLLKHIWNQVLAKKIPLATVSLAILGFIFYFQIKEPKHTLLDKNKSTRQHGDTDHNKTEEEIITEKPSLDTEPVETVQKPIIKPPAITEQPMTNSLESSEDLQEVKERPTMQTPQTEVIPKQKIIALSTPTTHLEEKPVTQTPKIVQPQVSSLAKKIATLRIHNPSNRKIIDVDIPKEIHLGETLNIKMTPYGNGYLEVILIDTEDNVIFPLSSKEKEYREVNQTCIVKIKTSAPAGRHYVVVIFTAIKYDFSLNNYHRIIKNLANQSGGMEYVNIYPINIYE